MSENGEVTIDKETFRAMAPEDQNWVLFKTIKTQRDFCHTKTAVIDKEIGKLKSRKKFDTGVAATTGVLGGVMAFIGKWMFFKG